MDLLERQDALDELQQCWRNADAGSGKLVLIAGEAGVGKSALVEAFVHRQNPGTRVVWGNCDALQTPRPLGPVYEIAAALGLRSAARSGEDALREALFCGVVEALSSERSGCAMVVLEDLHWGDQASFDFLRYVGRRIQRIRCLFIATFRDDEVSPTHALRRAVGELTGDHTRRIRLSPLSEEAVTRLADANGRDGKSLYRITAGNPFFIRELLSTNEDVVPQTVRDAVIARLMRWSPESRSVAELVSVVPGRTEYWLIDAVLGADAILGEDWSAGGILTAQGTALAFRHELGRLAVESSLPPARARELHSRVLGALMALDPQAVEPAEIVHHAERAGATDILLEYAPRAGREAARVGAHHEAVAHFGAALRHCHHLLPDARAALFEAHAQECNLTNRVAPAIDSAGQALALWRKVGNVPGEARMLRLLSRQHWEQGDRREAERLVEEAIALLEEQPRGPDLGMAYSAQSQLAMLSGRVDEALESGTRALDLARRFGDNETQAHALNNMGAARLGSGDESGYQALERSLAIALEHNLPEHAARAYGNLSTCSVLRHDLPRAARYLASGISYCEEREIHTHLEYLRAYAARFELEKGNWAEAAELATSLLRTPGRMTAVQRIPTLLVLALVRIRRGDPGVDELLDEAWTLAEPTRELQRIGRVTAARAEQAWYQGDLQRLAAAAELGLRHAVGHRDPWIKGELVWWKSRAGPADPPPEDIAEPYRHMVAGDWQTAAGLWHDLGLPYGRALALAMGPPRALLQALPLADSLGAVALGRMIRHRLREQGVRSVSRGPRESTRNNPAGLTVRELEVLELLAEGLSNADLAERLHRSERTIHRHVTSILGKLGVRSRSQATAAAFSRGIVAPKR